MSSNTYSICNSTNPISLEADIQTVGLAASRAIVLSFDGTDSGTAVAHSWDATGDIPRQHIGDHTFLKSRRLLVFTQITLAGRDADARSKEAEAISSTYMLDGGDDGVKTYNNAIKTYLDPTVYLNFTVNL